MFLGYKIDLRIGGMKYGWNFEIYLRNISFFFSDCCIIEDTELHNWPQVSHWLHE